jgi:AcrR family transcriptional regulator
MEATASLSPLKTARRDKIVEAAQGLFTEQGYRATTMEGIAAAAGMSKVTVYGYFADKDEVFAAVAERLAGRLKMALSAAMSREGALAQRISAALIEKHSIVFDLVRSSPFSGELFAAKDRQVAYLFAKLDEEIEALLADRLEKAGWQPEDASARARLLFAASQGIANRAKDMAQTRQDIETLVNALV